MNLDPEHSLCESWSIGRLRPWLQMVAERELPDRLRGRLDASDVVQQTLLKAWQGESRFDGTTHEQRLAWLRTIMRNTIRDNQRRILGTNKRGGGRERLATDVFPDNQPGLDAHPNIQSGTPSRAMIASEAGRAFASALEQLPEDQRRVIELRHAKGLTHADIAEQMKKSEPAVRMLWVRALQNLRQTFGNESGETE